MNTQTNIVYISFGLLSCFSLYTYFQLQQTLDECQHKLDKCNNDLEDTHKTLYNVFKIQELTYRQINTVIDTLNKKPNPIPKPIGEHEPILPIQSLFALVMPELPTPPCINPNSATFILLSPLT